MEANTSELHSPRNLDNCKAKRWRSVYFEHYYPKQYICATYTFSLITFYYFFNIGINNVNSDTIPSIVDQLYSPEMIL